MAYCTNCGCALPEGARFCPQCGTAPSAPLSPQPNPTADTPTMYLSPDMATPPSAPAVPAVAPPSWYTPASAAEPPARPAASAVVGFVLGVLSALLSWLSIFVLPLLIPAGILALVGFFKSPATRRALAVAALIICGVALLLTTFFTVLYVVLPDETFEDDSYEYYYDDYFDDPDEFPDFGYFDEFDPYGDGFFDGFFNDFPIESYEYRESALA